MPRGTRFGPQWGTGRNGVQQVAKDRILSGRAFLAFVAVVSFAVVAFCWTLGGANLPILFLLMHISASLCLLWTLAGYVLWRHPSTLVVRPRVEIVVAVLERAAVAAGLFAVVVLVYAVGTEVVLRTLLWRYAATPGLRIWPGGFVSMGAIAIALLLAWRKSGNREVLTALLWLLVLAAFWAALQAPAFTTDAEGYPSASRWVGILALAVSLVSAVFVAATGIARRRVRLRAWPATLHLLTEPPVDWRSLRYSIGILSAAILVLGCAQIAVPWTGPAAILAGWASLTLAHRQWSESLADVGLALITLGITSLLTACFPALPRWWTAPVWAELLNRVLLGLALMVGLWYWLAAVWRQQLDDGRAWTTTGHLVGTTQRVGYFVASLAVLISCHLAVWPAIPYGSTDASAWRWAWGLAAQGLLVLVLLWAAVSTRKLTVGWLCVLAMCATAAFVIVRTPQRLPGRIWALYWPVVLAAAGGAMVLLAGLLARVERFKPLFEPVYLTGVAIMPLAAIAGILYRDPRIIPPWVPAITFGSLVVVYLLVAVMIGPKTFAAVAVLCAALCFWRLQDATGWTDIALPYYYSMLICLSGGLWAWVVYQRRPVRPLRIIQWAGMALAVLSVLVGWLVSSAGP